MLRKIVAFAGVSFFAAMVAVTPAAPIATGAKMHVHERYIGTRTRTFDPSSPTPYVKAFADRYSVVDDETVRQVGDAIQRDDTYDFEPIGTPLESPAPQVAQRTRSERIVRHGNHQTIEMRQETATIDHQTSVPSVVVVGVAQDETKTTTYRKPRIAVVLSGAPANFRNAIAREERNGSKYSGKTVTVAADGSLTETSQASVATESYSQSPNGSAHYTTAAVGFYSNDLTIAEPAGSSGKKTIHVERVTTGRRVGPNPAVRSSFDVPDWYPGESLGAETDVVRAVGIVAMPADCQRPLNLTRGYESIETRSRTRATGEIYTQTVTTYTSGTVILCTIDDTHIETHDVTTGLIASKSSDRIALHLTRDTVDSAPSIVLVAPHVMPIHQPADPDVTGAPALVLQTGHTDYVGVRIGPAMQSIRDASVTVSPSLAAARIGDDGYIAVQAGPIPARMTLTVRLHKNVASASIPIFIYNGLSIGCEGDQMRAAAFTSYGSVELVTDPAKADVYADCKDERYTAALHFPLGAVALRFDDNSAVPFTTVRADQWQPATQSLDDASVFAGYIRAPNSPNDDSRNILLIKTHTGEVVKVDCSGRGSYSLVGKYAISKHDVFAF